MRTRREILTGRATQVPIALRVLLARVLDYAGLFPPAKLPMAEAFREYAALRREPESWMLARFVCPAARLEELSPFVDESFRPGEPLPLALLADGGDSGAAFTRGVRAAVMAGVGFLERHGRRAAADQLEIRLPAPLLAEARPESVARLLEEALEILPAAGLPWLLVVEAPLRAVVAAVAGIARANATAGGSARACLKVRCGGLEAASFPSAAELAGAVAACREHDVLLGATQGLHHPLARRDPALGVRTHGFVNLIAAALLAHARRLEASRLAEILEDGEPAHFAFSGESFAWGGETLTVAEIAAGRREAFASFGSCSFTEPREDLRSLGWLPRV